MQAVITTSFRLAVDPRRTSYVGQDRYVLYFRPRLLLRGRTGAISYISWPVW